MTPPCEVRWRSPFDPVVATAWRDLQAAGGVGSVFTSWDFFDEARRDTALVRNVDVAVVSAPGTARTPANIPAGFPIGLAAFEVVAHRGMRVLTFATASWATGDHLDVVARRDDAATVATAIVDAIGRRRDFDLVDLDGCDADSPLVTAFARLRPPRFGARAPIGEDVPGVTLDPAQGDAQFAAKVRQRYRRDMRRVGAAGGGLTIAATPDAVAAGLDELVELHAAQWGARATVFATPERVAFARRVARRLAADGAARLYRLHAAGRTEAIAYLPVWDGIPQYYLVGRPQGPTVAEEPGKTLLTAVLLDTAARGGTRVDLLRGRLDYKLRVATPDADQRQYRLRSFRLSPALWRFGLDAAEVKVRRFLDRDG